MDKKHVAFVILCVQHISDVDDDCECEEKWMKDNEELLCQEKTTTEQPDVGVMFVVKMVLMVVSAYVLLV